jgi:hypothetical protein
MSYIIKTYNGSKLTVVNEGSVDNKSTSIQFVGKNYAGYGPIQNDNFLFLLENFANELSPTNPLRGQLWYDLQENKLKLYDRNSKWRVIGGADTSENYPNYLTVGEFWLNQSGQVYVKTASGPVLVGPSALTDQGTGMQTTVLYDIDGGSHTVLEAVIQSNTSFIISTDTTPFTLDPISSPRTGFNVISPGITLRNFTDKFNGKILWTNIEGKPSFATVATSGSYNDLTNKPTLFSGSYNDLTNKPTLFSGSYNDLTNKPTFATVATSGSYTDLTNKPTIPT